MENNTNPETNTDATPTTPVSVVLPYAKPFPDVSNIEIFANKNFKRWQERVYSLLNVHGVAHAFLHPQSGADVDKKILKSRQYANEMSDV